jgi:radical SAM protein with 4Fe4S-binding SPASM domain
VTTKTPVTDKFVDLGNRLYPTGAFFELTHRCNGRCEYCYVPDKENAKDLDTASVLCAIDKLSDAGVLHVTFTGGEIFIRPDILEILQHAIDRNFWFVGLMTNGTLLTKQHMDFIIDNRLRLGGAVSMTVFSHIPEVNDSYFGIPGALSKILANGEYLQRGGVKVGAKINVMDFNLETFIETHQFLAGRGFLVMHFVGTLCYSTPGRPNLKRYNEKEFIKEYLKRLPNDDLQKRKDTLASKLSAANAGDFCVGRSTGICIGHTGIIKPCVGFRDSGTCNILDKGNLRDILVKAQSIAEARAISQEDVAKCRECQYLAYCAPCLADMRAEHDDFSSPPSKTCNWVHALLEV